MSAIIGSAIGFMMLVYVTYIHWGETISGFALGASIFTGIMLNAIANNELK